MINILKLLTKEISDQYIRDNFSRLNSYFQDNKNLLGFQHVIITVVQTGANQKFAHNLGFQPLDVIVTSAIGSGLIQFNYSDFDKINLDFSVVSGTPTRENPTVIRAYVGSHIEGTL